MQLPARTVMLPPTTHHVTDEASSLRSMKQTRTSTLTVLIMAHSPPHSPPRRHEPLDTARLSPVQAAWCAVTAGSASGHMLPRPACTRLWQETVGLRFDPCTLSFDGGGQSAVRSPSWSLCTSDAQVLARCGRWTIVSFQSRRVRRVLKHASTRAAQPHAMGSLTILCIGALFNITYSIAHRAKPDEKHIYAVAPMGLVWYSSMLL
jgi:hypothetical protein